MGKDHMLRQLERLVGRWKTTIKLVTSDSEEVGKSHATDVYSWSPNGNFLYHEVDAQMDGESHKSLEVIAINPDGDGFVSRSYDPDGSFSDYECWFKNEEWHIRGETLRFSGQFLDGGRILSGDWKQLTENKSWEPAMSVVLEREA